MIDYIYDGTFEGLLTSIYDAYYRSDEPDKILKESNNKQNLFSEKIVINTDQTKADKVYRAIEEKISAPSLKKVYYAFLSETEDIEIDIYYYLKLGFRIGKKIDKHFTDERILKVHKISRRVSHERHKMLGFIRFHSLEDDIFYAPFEPDYNIITLIAPHFARRLSNQNWVLHDCKRKVAVLYNQEEWLLTEFDRESTLENYTKDEDLYQELWKEFFDTVAIKNRKNPRLQRQFMPQRYWKYLVEKS